MDERHDPFLHQARPMRAGWYLAEMPVQGIAGNRFQIERRIIMPKTIFVRKPVTLAEVKNGIEECKRLFGSKGADYYVAEELQLSNQEWERLTESLLDDRYCFHQFSEKNHPETEEGTPCIRVTCPSSEIALIIDTQGYDYARYVGIEEANNSSEIEEEDEPMYEEDREDSSEIDEGIVQDALMGMLYGDWGVEDSALEGCRVRTFEDAGVMTYNKGVVVSLPDGSEFQITIVQSR